MENLIFHREIRCLKVKNGRFARLLTALQILIDRQPSGTAKKRR